MADQSAHAEAHHVNYVRIWQILLVLLVVSVLGPMIGIKVVTLITAFGIAVVKAYLVAKNFMHLNVQPGFVVYLLSTVLVFMLLLFAGTAPDVMKHEGDNWVKPAVVVKGPGTHHEASGEAHAEAAEAHGGH
jgi:caa(3)-type oxidase subunit IV